jgi:hypothetical protein
MIIPHYSPPAYFGKVDRVPGRFYVITRFFTLACFIPFVPLGTYLVRDLPDKRGNLMCLFWWRPEVLEESGNLMMRIPMSLKSVLLAWLRFGCIVVASVYGLFILDEQRFSHDLLISVIVVAVCTVMFVLSYRLGRPSASRAEELLGAYDYFVRAERLGILEPGRALEFGIPKEAMADPAWPNEEQF